MEPGDIIIDGGNSLLPRRHRPGRGAQAQGRPLRRRRHERRRVRPRARLLPHDRRRGRRRQPPRPDLPHHRPRRRRRAAHARAAPATRRPAENGYLHCGPTRRRPLREDGPQRHRVRDHGRLRRGPERPQATPTSARTGARGRRRDHAAARARSTTSTTSTSPTSPRCGAGAAWSRRWLLDLTAHALVAEPRPRRLRGPRLRLRRGALDGRSRPSTRASPRDVLTTALFDRFASRGEADFADRILSAMRKEFGGHAEKPAGEASISS